jgi:hypothetical protein
MSAPNPFLRPGLTLALERYREIRHVVCGLGGRPCTKADLDWERECSKVLTGQFSCQFIWPFNEPFDSTIYYRASPPGNSQIPPLGPGAHRVGAVVVPEVIKPTGWIAAHAVVEPVPACAGCV